MSSNIKGGKLKVLTQLRGRKVDTTHREPISNELWWLKPLFTKNKRLGITDCCQYNYECPHHKEVRMKTESQNRSRN